MPDTPAWWPLQWERHPRDALVAHIPRTQLPGGVAIYDHGGDDFDQQLSEILGERWRRFEIRREGTHHVRVADEFELLIALTAMASVPA
jgi:hypothetical protein